MLCQGTYFEALDPEKEGFITKAQVKTGTKRAELIWLYHCRYELCDNNMLVIV